jgi:predicted enzyme related to lactoylglutathione lyase
VHGRNLSTLSSSSSSPTRSLFAELYVADVDQALTFYQNAFGLERGFVDPVASFGQLVTGATGLSFATYERVERALDFTGLI